MFLSHAVVGPELWSGFPSLDCKFPYRQAASLEPTVSLWLAAETLLSGPISTLAIQVNSLAAGWISLTGLLV